MSILISVRFMNHRTGAHEGEPKAHVLSAVAGRKERKWLLGVGDLTWGYTRSYMGCSSRAEASAAGQRSPAATAKRTCASRSLSSTRCLFPTRRRTLRSAACRQAGHHRLRSASRTPSGRWVRKARYSPPAAVPARQPTTALSPGDGQRSHRPHRWLCRRKCGCHLSWAERYPRTNIFRARPSA